MAYSFYTDVTHNAGFIYSRGYENGRPFKRKDKYKPTLYVKSPNQSNYKSIKGQHLEPINPGSMWDCGKFIEKYQDVEGFEVYGTDRWVHQFIQDNWKIDLPWDRSLVNVTTLDIECQADQGFPDIRSAPMPITAITVKNNIDNIFYTWGLDQYDPTKTALEDVKIIYTKCNDEHELLHKFIVHWANHYPDVITGWNVRFFDLPYLKTRICKVLGDDSSAENYERYAKFLSPYKLYHNREVTAHKLPVIELYGIQQLDYLDLFRKFAYTYGTQASYALDNIAHVVLDEKKLDYSEYKSLTELYKEDHQKFIDYNIKDVQLVDRLEDKLGLITLAMTIAYRAGVNYTDTFSNVPVWDAIINRELRNRGVIENGRKYQSKDGQIEGAYVKDPLVGMHEWVCSFDLNSLYPHLIVQYNMSPETIISDQIDVTVDDLLEGKEYDIPEGYCMSARGNLFRTDRKGLLPILVEQYYADRMVAKKEMLEAQQQLQNFTGDKFDRYKLEKKIATLGNQQMAIKILMNSLYGAMSNEYFRYFDPRIAESITLSGQLTIRHAEKTLNSYLNNILSTDSVDYVIAIDTDSVYLHLGPLVNSVYNDGVSLDKGSAFLDKVANQRIEPLLEKAFTELKEYMKAPRQAMVMKREVLANKGIWTGKKHYILNVINSEGVQFKEPKLKMMGIEAVRSSTPMPCRDMIKRALLEIMNKDQQTVQDFIQKERVKFNSLPVEDISFPRGISDLNKYKDGHMIYCKGTPIHVRGALLHNHYTKDTNIDKIFPGDKVKFCYLKLPNMVKENVIAFKNILPEELNVRQSVDYDKQFDKGFLEPIKTILNAINWQSEKRATLEDFWS